MPEYRYGHAHIITSEPEKTARFYENVFKARRLGSMQLPDGRLNIRLELSGVPINVMHPRPETSFRGLEHIAISTDNLEAAVAELKANGAIVRNDVKVPPGFRVVFMQAPENVLIELQELKS